jgi:tape measure domain-containing protein
MPSRDVELIVKLKDQASKGFEEIAEAIGDFSKAQLDSNKVIGTSDTVLNRFTKSVGGLDKAIKSISSADRLTKNLENVQNVAAKLEVEIAGTRDEIEKLGQQFSTTTAQMAGSAERMAQLTQQLERQQTAYKATKTAVAALESDLRKATATRATLVTAEKNLEAGIEGTTAALAKAEGRYAAVSAQIAAVDKPTKALGKSLEAASIAVQKNEEKLAGQNAELEQARAAMAGFDAVIADFGAALVGQNAELAQSDARVKELAAAYNIAEKETKGYAATLKEVSAAQDKANNSIGRQETELKQAAASLEQFQNVAQKTKTEIDQLATALKTTLKNAFSAQQSTVSQTNNAFQANRTAIRELAQVMGSVGVPTKAMADAMAQLNTNSRALQTSFKEQSAVLKTLSAAYIAAGSDVGKLAAASKESAAAVARGQQALAGVKASAEAAAASSARLVAENNRVAAAYRAIGAGSQAAGGAARILASENDKVAASYRRSAEASRQAMSYIQRLRGEVLALISAYGGFQGAISILQQTVSVFQTMEAATARLGAVNGGDVGKTASELDFIRRNADRLGISLGVLADEYTKFSAATKNTVIEGKATRDVFISIAEAGRVNKLSLDEMQRVYKAVTQIANKGKFQLEELSGQLGEVIPGALQTLADGLGVTTEELLEMTKNGEVMSSKLIDFAKELDKRYGGQLAKSLTTTTTAMGQLQNAVFQALAAFGNAGFMEGFTELVRDLTEVLKDPDFLAFAKNISAALGVMASAVGEVVKNFKVLIPLVGAFIGFKLAPFLANATLSFLGFSRGAKGAGDALKGAAPWITGAGTAAAGAAGRFGLLAIALRGLLSATGIGLAITAVTTAIGFWATEADLATEAMVRHTEIVDIAKNAYDKAGGSVTAWRKEVEQLSLSLLEDEIKKFDAVIADSALTGGTLDNSGGLFGDSTFLSEAKRNVRDLAQAYQRGEVSVQDFNKAVEEQAKKFGTDEVKEWSLQMQRAALAMAPQIEKLKELKLIQEAKTEGDTKAEAALKKLNGVTEENTQANADAIAKQKEFASAMEEINKLLPGVSENMKEQTAIAEGWHNILKAIANLDFSNLTWENMQKILSGSMQLINRQDQLNFGDAAKDLSKFTTGIEAATALIRKREGFISGAKWDVNAFRVGFGSDTTTDVNGNVSKVLESTVVTMTDAVRDLNRRTGEFMNTVVKQVGSDTFGGLNPQQQAVLTSIAYNYGSLPDRIVKAVQTGNKGDVSAAILGLQTDNKGVNAGRRREEAFLFSNGEFDVANADRVAKAETDRLEKRKEFNTELDKSLAGAQQDAALADQDIIRRETAKALREAEAEKGAQLNAEEIAKVTQRVQLQYQEQANQDAINAKKKEGEALEQRVTDLQTRRTELLAQQKLYQESGDNSGVARTKEELVGVNAELQKAIAAAIAFQQQLGGSAADASIAKLQTMQLETAKVGQQAQSALLDWKRVGELFASGLTNAFDRFAQAVANGEDVGKAAAEAFLQFAADFLIEIGKMIIQQAILNALRGLFGGTFGGVGGAVGLGHTGGLVGSKRVGSGNASRRVDPGVFLGAPRFHDGGVIGLRPNEIPIIAKKNEEMLKENDPRNILNGGAAAGGAPTSSRLEDRIRIVNAFDAGEVVSQGLSSSSGERTLLNFVRQNASPIKDILGSA